MRSRRKARTVIGWREWIELPELCATPLKAKRVRSSNGRVETRPLIVVDARAAGLDWPIELTLASRDEMGFRMFLVSQAPKKARKAG